MRVFIVIAGVLAAAFYLRHGSRHESFHVPPFVATQGAGDMQTREFTELLDGNIALSDLAAPAGYTLVEVYLDHCSYCRELEAALPALRSQRPDITVVRVHHPGSIQRQFSGNTREQMQAAADTFATRMTRCA